MRVLHYNPRNFDAESGDIMVDFDGRAYRLYSRRDSPSCAAGELFTRQIKRPGQKAKIVDGKLVWKASA